jgi:hypothetical protein
MLPILYLILIRRNGSPYPEVTVVSLPSSLMIVHSNAFVYSTSLLGVDSRYGYYVIFNIINKTILNFTVFPEPFSLKNSEKDFHPFYFFYKRLFLCRQDFLIV